MTRLIRSGHAWPAGLTTRVLMRASTLLAVGVLLMVVASSARASADCTDMFNCLSLAQFANNSQPFAANKSFSISTDISTFDLQSNERSKCQTDTGFAWGNNSAWYRFDAAVPGQLSVTADTTAAGGFPVLMVEFRASHEGAIDYTNTTDLPEGMCSAHGSRVSFDQPLGITTNGPTFVQLMAYCGDTGPNDPNPCPAPEPGGRVTLTFSFTCDDQDHDGTCDPVDQCPNQAGTIAARGCPDADADGIPDNADACPNAAGVISAAGCPDADGDGFPDPPYSFAGHPTDACPSQAGVVSAQGCPDADGDGVMNSLDACPTVAGAASADGCPDADGDGFPNPPYSFAGHPSDACPHDRAPAPGSKDGCSDSDHDGVDNSVDKCPKQRGPKEAHGCPDRDRDGVPNSKDKCPKTYADPHAAVSQAKRNGCPGPINARFNWDFSVSHSVNGKILNSVLTKWTLAPVPRRALVRLTCRGSCPRGFPMSVHVRGSRRNLLSLLRRIKDWRSGSVVQLPAGATITATVSHGGVLSKRQTLTGTADESIACQANSDRFTASCPA